MKIILLVATISWGVWSSAASVKEVANPEIIVKADVALKYWTPGFTDWRMERTQENCQEISPQGLRTIW